MNNTNFSYAVISGLDLSNVSTIYGAKFSGVDLQTTKLPIFLQYVDFRGAILAKLNLDRCDLSNADFREADLTNIRIHHARMDHADLRWSKLINADVFKASFSGAKFYQCDVSGTDMNLADISGIDLYGIINMQNRREERW